MPPYSITCEFNRILATFP